mmetsp:Transcript_2097/g.6403  ORF Transcript_2097/g.6403 Transcript_2097/m.6403 type:complete len:89 (+) Transcript_2097:288-554(+)
MSRAAFRRGQRREREREMGFENVVGGKLKLKGTAAIEKPKKKKKKKKVGRRRRQQRKRKVEKGRRTKRWRNWDGCAKLLASRKRRTFS